MLTLAIRLTPSTSHQWLLPFTRPMRRVLRRENNNNHKNRMSRARQHKLSCRLCYRFTNRTTATAVLFLAVGKSFGQLYMFNRSICLLVCTRTRIVLLESYFCHGFSVLNLSARRTPVHFALAQSCAPWMIKLTLGITLLFHCSAPCATSVANWCLLCL